MQFSLSRRRVVTLLAAAAGVPLFAGLVDPSQRLYRWSGTALGAPASLQLYHTDPAMARAAVADAVAELERLEAIFSLYRPDSALSRLNRDGLIDPAPPELVHLVKEARRLAAATDGAFDPTIQPLWQVYFRHFTGANPDPAGPAAHDIAAALGLVDWQAIAVEEGEHPRLRLLRPGMAVSLNGIAQGFISDCTGDVLRHHGFDRMLIDMGEPLALSRHPNGNPWRIGIADPTDPQRTVTVLDVVDRAVATSGGYGTCLDPAGVFTHLFDPRTGRTAPARCGVTVVAGRAALADGLSTALAVAPVARRQAILSAIGDVLAVFVAEDGAVTRLSA